MRTPDELHLVDWASLGHGADVADLIRALYDEDAAVVGEALGELFHRLLHQGSVYPASVMAVPYLAHAALHAVHHRRTMLVFLANAGRDDYGQFFEDEVMEGIRVADELPGLLHLVRDEDPEVRRQTVRVARWAAGDSLPLVLDAVAACHRDDPSDRVRAEALEVLSRLAPRRDERLRAALADPAPAVRATAALGLLESAGAPWPAELVAVLLADGGDPDFAVSAHEFFHGVGSTEERVASLLREQDAETVRAVAAAWIAAGDHEGRGSRRAVELVMRWRGWEVEAVTLLTAAVPQQRDPYVLQQVINSIERWAGYHADPDTVAEAVLPHVTHPDSWVATSAQLVLGRVGDSRLLTAVAEPAGDALAALAARTDDPEIHRRALRPQPCRYGHHLHSRAAEVIESLTPEAAAGLLPELTALLRESPSPDLARALGGTGLALPELTDLLVELTRSDDQALACAAAVAAARLGADPAPALRLLAERLEHDGGSLAETALLGPLGAPLAPSVECHLTDGSPERRGYAAMALWQITGDPAGVVTTLTALVRDGRTDPSVLKTLRQTGAPLPPDVRATVAEWAGAERRVLDAYSWIGHPDTTLREEARLLLAGQG
ncbi:HEAT repeat domain-containing protein [Kitasatospora sp. CB01950]|uniref:HEAT repeat domain-containing protein n=1 Tax=Kitasatospora sp. CB01950 TaxID=1703930 RepID=UPI000939FA1B|nr:HEAT repeat domain-containing protein [Kitasatospora sp. CB01950]OKJ08209.1 hypothetical protein AMK19_19470 [Kitasatospora sp. CB01950]